MKFRLYEENDEENILYFKILIAHDGDASLVVSNEEDEKMLLYISAKDGKLHLSGNIWENFGLKLDKNGYIEIARD